MNTKELLLNQFEACFDTPNWFVPVMKALEGVTDQESELKGAGTNHSIRELTDHMIFWNDRYLKRLKNIPLPEYKSGIEATFEKGETALSWKDTVDKISSVLKELSAAIRDSSDEKLSGKAFGKIDDSWYSVICNINIHNAYHTGQIVILRKLHGTWNPELGVN